MDGQRFYGVADIADTVVKKYGCKQTNLENGKSSCETHHSQEIRLHDGKTVKLESLKRAIRRHLGARYGKRKPFQVMEVEYRSLLDFDADFRDTMLRFFHLEPEEDPMQEEWARAKERIASERQAFEENARGEEVAVRQGIEELVADRTIRPEERNRAIEELVEGVSEQEAEALARDREEFLQRVASIPPEEQQLGMSPQEELAFMVRALFLQGPGREFDFDKFRHDLAVRDVLEAELASYPQKNATTTRNAVEYERLNAEIERTLEGRDISAYLKSSATLSSSEGTEIEAAEGKGDSNG